MWSWQKTMFWQKDVKDFVVNIYRQLKDLFAKYQTIFTDESHSKDRKEVKGNIRFTIISEAFPKYLKVL